MSSRYEFIDHTADVAVRAYGDSLADAFGAAARAMFDIITGNAEIKPEREISVFAEADDLEGLLVGFLSKLILAHEVANIVLGEFVVSIEENGKRVTAQCKGEAFDRERHGQGMHVKAVAYHMMEINDGGTSGESSVQVLFDV